MNVKKTSFAALLVAVGLSSSAFVYAAVNQLEEYPLELATNETNSNTPAAVVEDGAVEEDVLPKMNMEELQAEIQKACDELAVDESVTAENRATFIEDCVSENTPIEGASEDEMAAVPLDTATTDEIVPTEEEASPEDTAAVPKPLPQLLK